MALNFPASPTLNQVYTVGSSSWTWDGTTWKSYGTNVVLPSGGTTGQVLGKDSSTDYDVSWLSLGSASLASTGDFATATQGSKADTALQPASIGVSVQAYDVDLTSWAAITPSSKQNALVSGTNIKTVNSTSLLGSGDLQLFTGGLTKVEVVASLPGTPNANTLYIVTG